MNNLNILFVHGPRSFLDVDNVDENMCRIFG